LRQQSYLFFKQPWKSPTVYVYVCVCMRVCMCGGDAANWPAPHAVKRLTQRNLQVGRFLHIVKSGDFTL